MKSELEKIKMSKEEFDALYEIDEDKPTENKQEEQEEQFLTEEEMEYDKRFHQDTDKEVTQNENE